MKSLKADDLFSTYVSRYLCSVSVFFCMRNVGTMLYSSYGVYVSKGYNDVEVGSRLSAGIPAYLHSLICETTPTPDKENNGRYGVISKHLISRRQTRC